jgi:hypothetical protein
MFSFDPREYAATFSARDYVHVPGGLGKEFYQTLSGQIAKYQEVNRLKQFALGNKQQALYEFPRDEDYRQFVATIGALSGLDPDQLVISERHIKMYEPGADPNPMPHKDRFATQLAVGFTVSNPHGSRLVIYPETDRGVNPFNSWAELRDALPPEKLPPHILQNAQRVEFYDKPGDIIMFRGNEIWHTRENGADTVMLYFKINAFHSDPLGEDPHTQRVHETTLQLLTGTDSPVIDWIPVLGRRVDHIGRRYNGHWQEVLGVVVGNQPFFIIGEQEWHFLRSMDGQKPLGAVLEEVAGPTNQESLLNKVGRLAQRGIVDLLSPDGSSVVHSETVGSAVHV